MKPKQKARRQRTTRESLFERLSLDERFQEQDGAIYALPETLIDKLQPARGKKFFSFSEERFERSLAEFCGGGCYRGKPIAYPLLPGASAARRVHETSASNSRIDANDQLIKQMQEDEMLGSGRSPEEVKSYFESQEAIQSLVHDHQAGYAGWLATNAVFRKELRGIKESLFKARLRNLLPQMPKSFFSEPVRSMKTQDRHLASALQMFCRRWAIDSMVTWQLPLPIAPHFGNSLYKMDQLEPAGVSLFLPWYLTRGRRLKVQEIQEAQRLYTSPSHLADWLDGRPKNLGHQRFAMMLRLYVCLELVLRVRYRAKIDGNIELFDCAFARYLREDYSPDSVKKLRLIMDRRLKNE